MPISGVYEMVTSLGGLRSWLSRDVTGDARKNGELRFGFGPEQATEVQVTDCKLNRTLVWTVTRSTFATDGSGIGTKVKFTFAESPSRGTLLTLEHNGWSEITPFYRICGYQWEQALESLKKVCETGRGEPITPSMLTNRKATGWFPVS